MLNWAEIIEECHDDGDLTLLHILEEDHYKCMQFTGLKDRNGKEIYEGDIVRFVVDYSYGVPPIPSYDSENGTVCIDFVIFQDGSFWFFDNEMGSGAIAFRHHEHCEVIGNLHENPDLLPVLDRSDDEVSDA